MVAWLAAVVDEGGAWAAELVVERDGGCEADKALKDAFAQACERAGAVAFEGENVFAGAEDALDALTDRREMRSSAGLVAARRGLTIEASMSPTARAKARPA